MKHLLSLVIWSALVLVLSSLGHWTLGVLSSFAIIPIFRHGGLEAAILGFLSGSIAWGALAYYLDLGNGHVLSQMIGTLLTLSSTSLVLITAMIGGIGIALSGWAASNLLSTKN